jgi:hypothetical protein
VARTLALSVIAFAVAMTWTSPQAAADSPPSTAVFAIGKCIDPGQPALQRPARFAYNCDDTGVMEDMTWTSWDAEGAQGSGTDKSIECQPNCAQGTLLTNPILVHAWNPLPPNMAGCPPDVQFYSDMTIAYPNGAPPWIKPGTSWTDGTDFVTVDGLPAVHFSDLQPECRAVQFLPPRPALA